MCSRDAKYSTIGTRGLFFAIALTIVSLFAWAKAPQQTIGPGMLPPKKAKATFAAYKAAGWVPLLEPDSRFVPGTIFRAVPGQWPQWISSLESCGVPKTVLKPVRNNTGAFQYSGDSVYSSSALLQLPGISAGPEFKKVQSVSFRQSDAGASAIDIIKVGDWIRKNHEAFSEVCRAYLAKPNTYVAQESYRVGSGTYTLKDGKDVALHLQGVLFISPSAEVKKSGESSLSLTVPVYTAVHGAVYANDLLELMTAPARGVLNYGDNEINSALPDSEARTAAPDRGVVAAGTSPVHAERRQGNYYAIVIGINNYQYEPPLQTPLNDAKEVAELLQRQFGFQVMQLPNAGHDQILEALDHYRSSLSEDDSLLIYFAGHGFDDKAMKQAYWLPVDAQQDTFSHWISATDITDRARAYRARHVLIISDSCYSGMITRGADTTLDRPSEHDVYIDRMLERKSRDVMSSGGDEPVADDGCPGHSIFACVLLQNLSQLNGDRFTGQELFNKVQVQVMGRSGQTPYYRFINDSGHDGGDFVFSKASIAVSPIVIIAPPPKDKDKEGVQAALDAYQRAYDSMAPQNMKEIWPSISREQLNDLKKSFSMFRAITVELRQRETTVDGNTATVHCYQWLQYTDDTLTRHPPQTWPVEIILAKNSSGQWLVTNVNKK